MEQTTAANTPATPNFCPSCGVPLAGGARFCGNCGAAVRGTTDPASAATAPESASVAAAPDPASTFAAPDPMPTAVMAPDQALTAPDETRVMPRATDYPANASEKTLVTPAAAHGPTPSAPPSRTNKTPAIIGAVLGVAVFAIVVVALIIFKPWEALLASDGSDTSPDTTTETVEDSPADNDSDTDTTNPDEPDASNTDTSTTELPAPQLICRLPAEALVVFDNSIDISGIELTVNYWTDADVEESMSVPASACTVFIDTTPASFTESGELTAEGLSAGTHSVTFEYELAETTNAPDGTGGSDTPTTASCTASLTLADPYGGASDEDLLALGQENVIPMFNEIYLMAVGQYPDVDWGDCVTENNKMYLRVKGADSIEEVESLWYEKFSKKYTPEEACGFPSTYCMIDGKLYSETGGVGWEADTYVVTDLTRASRDEVVFSGYYTASMFPGVPNTDIEFSLVYEDGEWKYGYMIW